MYSTLRRYMRRLSQQIDVVELGACGSLLSGETRVHVSYIVIVLRDLLCCIVFVYYPVPAPVRPILNPFFEKQHRLTPSQKSEAMQKQKPFTVSNRVLNSPTKHQTSLTIISLLTATTLVARLPLKLLRRVSLHGLPFCVKPSLSVHMILRSRLHRSLLLLKH